MGRVSVAQIWCIYPQGDSPSRSQWQAAQQHGMKLTRNGHAGFSAGVCHPTVACRTVDLRSDHARKDSVAPKSSLLWSGRRKTKDLPREETSFRPVLRILQEKPSVLIVRKGERDEGEREASDVVLLQRSSPSRISAHCPRCTHSKIIQYLPSASPSPSCSEISRRAC